jgi:hypothetical protein
MCNPEFSVLVASLHGSLITARFAKATTPVESHSYDFFCDSRRAYFRLLVQVTPERHDFDKRPVGGMTEEPKLKIRVSTLDRFHDESKHRLPIPARYIVDSEGVTNADVAFGIAFASAKCVPGMKEQVTSSDYECIAPILLRTLCRHTAIQCEGFA